MNFTNEQMKNISGHIVAAKLLLPYRDLIQEISNNLENYKKVLEQNPKYEDLLDDINQYCNVSDKLMAENICKVTWKLLNLFTAGPITAKAYLAMMDIVEKYPEAV
jgi:hypothetical protein